MTNLASSWGIKATSSSKNPSSLIASRDGGVTRILGSGDIGGIPGDVVEEEGERVVAYRYDRGWICGWGILEGPAIHWIVADDDRMR
jgi:hypothetical protein